MKTGKKKRKKEREKGEKKGEAGGKICFLFLGGVYFPHTGKEGVRCVFPRNPGGGGGEGGGGGGGGVGGGGVSPLVPHPSGKECAPTVRIWNHGTSRHRQHMTLLSHSRGSTQHQMKRYSTTI